MKNSTPAPQSMKQYKSLAKSASRFAFAPLRRLRALTTGRVWAKRAVAGLATLVLVAVGSGLQSNILKVDASPDVLLVSHTAIPFGTVFPGEILRSEERRV